MHFGKVIFDSLHVSLRSCDCIYDIRNLIIIIIIISIFKEDNVFSITASLPYGPPVNTDIDYYRTFFRTCLFLQVLLS